MTDIEIPARVVAVDFDGTCVMHEFPLVGADVPMAASVLRMLVANDVKIVLWTMRGDEYLDADVEWFKQKEIPLWGVNENPEQKEWTRSPKAYAQLYIDDAALGCPLVHGVGMRAFVDWMAVRNELVRTQWIPFI